MVVCRAVGAGQYARDHGSRLFLHRSFALDPPFFRPDYPMLESPDARLEFVKVVALLNPSCIVCNE